MKVICPFLDRECLIYKHADGEKCYFDSLVGKIEGVAGQAVCGLMIIALAMVKQAYGDKVDIAHFGNFGFRKY